MVVSQIISKFLGGSFDQNTFVFEHKGECILIDAGAEIEDIESVLGKKKLSAVLITHAHFDHIYNIEKIVERFNCDVYISKGAEEKFLNPMKNASFLVRQNMVFNVDSSKIKYYDEKISFKKFDVKVYKTPGHASDSVCLLIGSHLFTGDTVFDDFIGRCDLYDSSPKEMENSLKLIRQIEFETAYPGHYDIAKKQAILKVIDRIVR